MREVDNMLVGLCGVDDEAVISTEPRETVVTRARVSRMSKPDAE